MSIVAADAASGEIVPTAVAGAVEAALSAPRLGHGVDLGGAEATARILLDLPGNGPGPGAAGA
jgi:hypothetical protein